MKQLLTRNLNMTGEYIALMILKDHFDAIGWPFHMHQQKLFERASIKRSDDLTDEVVSEVERHRPILGGSYTKGVVTPYCFL